MFYLLEDNRIIDSNEYFKYAYAYKNGITYYNVTIKKQSENVYDLIEVGDLVRYKTNCLEIEHLYAIENLYEDFVDYAKRGYFNILAIYKPNEKGDYIKVWEAKND